MNDSIQLVWNKYEQVVPLKTFQVSMTEGQLKFLLECISTHEDKFPCDQSSVSSGFLLGDSKSIQNVLQTQIDQLRQISELMKEYSHFRSRK